MKTFLRFVLWLIALVVLAVFSWAVSLYLSWPSWGWSLIFFGVLGAYFGIQLARRLWYLSRSRVKLAASEAAGRKVADKPNGLGELTAKWKQGITTLKSSSLRRFGNPIYALPWFMVVGESGVGKTSAITRSRLASLNKNISQFEPITQTLNCDWWFFNRAVVIDTAGRYVSPEGDEDAQAEWERMLELLAKYRMKEGLNGLVLAIDAQQLMADDDVLERRGQAIRERVDQLIRLFDKRFPIFVMVTKSDLVYGFKEWAKALPPEALNQAMGYTGSMEQGDGAEIRFLDAALSDITGRLKLLRLDMAVKGVEPGPELLLFPDELQRLRAGLQRFLKACASNNPYLEQPLLRGLFFSSARQTDAHLPSAIEHLLNPAATPVSASEKGLFLHDFFERVLPADRWTFLPTVIVHHWRQVTRNLAIVAWVSIFTAILVFLLLSYYQTRASLIEIERVYPQQLAEENTADEALQLENLHRILTVIDLILDREQQWQTRWLAFSPDITQLEEDIKQSYVHGYQEFLNTYRPENLLSNVALAEDASPEYAEAVLGLVRTINLSKARIQGADYHQLQAMPQMPAGAVQALLPGLPAPVVKVAHRMQVAYKAWSAADDPFLQQRLANDQDVLDAVLTQSPKLEWLLPWANALPGLQPVTLREFWAPGSQGPNSGMIEPALTRQGAARLDTFLDELARAVEDPAEFQARRDAFESWHLNERFNSWQSFGWAFNNGERLLANEPAWRDMVGRVDTDASPYYRLFERLKAEFAGEPSEKLPGWLLFAREFNDMRHAATADHTLGRARAMLSTANNVGERIIKQSVANQSLLPMSELPLSIRGVQDFSAYAQAFDEAVAIALSGEGNAYQLAADYFNFGIDSNIKASDIQNILDNLAAFRKTSGFDHADDQVVWHLVAGPVNLLIRYVLEQSSCTMQKEWESQVLWRKQMAVSTQETIEQLFGEQGSVWAFADGPAKPFLKQQAAGFTPALKDGKRFPFSPDFIPFLNRSVDTQVASTVRQQQAEASVGAWANLLITSRPIGVNPGARARPYAANLSIQCSNEQITLDNFNMAVTSSFDWSPDQCGDVTLQIHIEDLTLTRRYPGPMGLARFVEEFTDGQRIFTPDDFPQARDELDALNVTALHVRYDLVGQEKLLEIASHLEYLAETRTASLSAPPSRLNLQVPDRVGQCWMEGVSDQPAPALPLYIRQRAQQIIDQPPPPPEPPHIQALAEAQTRAAPQQTPPPPQVQRSHRIQDGETLYSLARRFDTTVETLKELNNLSDADLIITGTLLKLPPEKNHAVLQENTLAPRAWAPHETLQEPGHILETKYPLSNN
ncbi:MAG: LysM peptidoglycan-binding domain-containing protein [Alcaligenaceae bacterium]|nr:LysM peptidoglycan-binding domain-containing protein [Alcaligenaceae bacterium]